MYLYMLKLGATPKGRLIEQHDVFFGIANQVHELIPHFEQAWAEIKDIWHIDAYRKVCQVDGHTIEIVPKDSVIDNDKKLYFINLGGYKPNHFEEYHHKMLVVAKDMAEATSIAKRSAFYQEFDIVGTRATSHIDNKYGVDVDEIFDVMDALPAYFKQRYQIKITATTDTTPDEMVIGYLPKKLFINPN